MSSLSSLYQKASGLPSYTGISTLKTSTGVNVGDLTPSTTSAFSSDITSASSFRTSYASDPLSLFGASSSSYLPTTTAVASAASWSTLDPLFPTLKRPGDEAFYSGDGKRAKFDVAATYAIYPQRPGEKDCVYYMRTRTCSFGASCKFDHPAWVPPGGIPDWKEVTTTPTTNQPLPVRAGEPDCAFYMKTGICKFGSKCKFNHPENKSATASADKKSEENVDAIKPDKIEIPVAETASKQAASNGGDGEGGNTTIKPASSYNVKGLPIRPGETECAFYMKTGSCKFGSACRFNHPEKPASTPLAIQQSQAAVTPVIAGGFAGPYGNYSIFPGVLPEYGLAVQRTDFGLQSLVPSPVYPQRPGESPCAFYMKTGVCKYGPTCKFHHPLNRTEAAQSDLKLTLAGFPRREGEPSCPFYMKTGTCKYGLNCKFDHPPPGEAAAKAIAEVGKNEQPEVGELVPNS